MNTQHKTIITEYNKEALIDIAKYLEFSEYEKEPIKTDLTFSSFSDLGNSLTGVLDAIEIIGWNSSESNDLGTCAILSQLARKLVPHKELEFLDSLLLKKENENEEFLKISNL